MKYSTNSAEFDFPKRTDDPLFRYMLVSTPRSGSNMLVRALWQAGIAGAPEEYLTRDFIADFSERFDLFAPNMSSYEAWASGDEVPVCRLEEYLSHVAKVRTSPNGCFGVKVHASHFFHEHLRLADLRNVIRPDKILRIRRLDVVEQAVSLIFAVETGVWIDDPEWSSILKPQDRCVSDSEYDFERIANACRYIEALERFLDAHLPAWNVPIYDVSYEQLCSHFPTEMDGIARFLGLEPSAPFPLPNIRKQVDKAKAEWIARFKKSKAQ